MNGFRRGAVHPTAIIGDGVELGRDVTVGANAVIHDNVRVGDGGIVGPHVILGEPLAAFYTDPGYINPELEIGPRAVIRSGSIIYAGSSIGSDLETGHRTTIREGAHVGHHLRAGTLTDIQGKCVIGNYVRMHSNVHAGQLSCVEDYVWIFPYVVLTNDPHPPSVELAGVTVAKFAVVATMAVVLPGVRVGRDALVGAHALVREDVPDETVAVGVPARNAGSVRQIRARVGGQPLYPWRYRYDVGLPWQGVPYDEWAASAPAL